MTDNIGVCATKKTIMKQEKKEFEAEWRSVLKLAVWIISLLALLKLLTVAL